MKIDATRREWIAGAFTGTGAALVGCAARKTAAAAAEVSITRAAAYDQTLYETVRRSLAKHRLDVRGRNVVLKPNLVEFEPGSVINTHPLVVHAAYEAFTAMGAASVRIAEGPGHRRNTLDLADAAGYFRIVPRFEEVFTDLNIDDVSQVHLPRQASRMGKLYLPNTTLRADLLVSIAKMKTHHWAAATLSMKNLFGTVPGALLRMAEEHAALGGYRRIDRRFEKRVSPPVRPGGWNRRHGRQRAYSRHGKECGRAGGWPRHGRGGRHLLSHYAH